ncbi:hypothetical protein AUC69_07335 [Methyloceanibacter superfactus]|uniref:Uncharacterized protein n=1 Tax=Methyloceanibacter superfactus TaxID=1774969 RepID=A0A1E3W5K4_9HYPH|nr:hypothetical protein [Methyloceanibacter superfactus]ODS01000.1 hypothetical protein AUC69_07335 [Methyloceanibacter superfactus]
MDETEKIISRLNGIDPRRPYFDPLAAEEAVRQHARLIGFRDVGITWAMGPKRAISELEGVDFDSPAACRWSLTMQALRDQATAELQRDKAVWQAYCEAQEAAEARIAETLHLEPFRLALFDAVLGEAGLKSHNVAYLVSSALQDVVASGSADSAALEDLNDVYLPFADAMLAGLGSFWVIGERFVCLPLPRLALQNGKLVSDGSPAAVWPNGEAYANGDEGLIPVLQSVEW